MRRRDFIKIVGSAVVTLPLAARAQQQAMPVIGFLNAASAEGFGPMVNAFRQGLKELGYVEGQNVTIEYRWANNQNDRLAALVDDLVRRRVSVIVANTPANLAAKAATTTIPIVFATGGDPVQLGLVTSLNRPGGNLTGVSQMNVEVAPKRLELLHELVPSARVIALLVNPTNPAHAEVNSSEVLAAADTLGLELHVLNASTDGELDGAFANLIQLRAGGLVIGPDPFFTSRNKQLAALGVRYAVPVVYENREFAAAGGLVSYGSDVVDTFRSVGIYTGRILKGDKPADLPVEQATKLELIINLKTARMLGITVPVGLMTRADEMIE
jgi:putative tryptophan/tyrosine transport system substrate-binding protein